MSMVVPDELIVVDQSEVESPEVAACIAGAPPGLVVRYLRQRPPHAQVARNRAIRESVGDILLFLDDDVLVEPDLIAAHLENYTDPTVAAVGGFFTQPGETPLSELPPAYFRKPAGWTYFPHCYTKRCDSGLFPSCNGSIRREVLRRAGGFDENFIRTQFDDTDLSCRLREIGARVVHDPAARLLHCKEPSGGNRPGGWNEHVVADWAAWQVWCYFFWINFGWRSWPEIAIRLRSCVFRRVNVVRPWYLAAALLHFVRGAAGAALAIWGGRRLGGRIDA